MFSVVDNRNELTISAIRSTRPLGCIMVRGTVGRLASLAECSTPKGKVVFSSGYPGMGCKIGDACGPLLSR